MKDLEQTILNSLVELKEQYLAIGIKAEFEDEGSSLEEIFHLKRFANQAGLDLTIKIGGCGALNDTNQAKMLEAKTLVAPMIESSYALKKFVQTANLSYGEQKSPNLFVNIETISGYKNFDEIFSIPEIQDITGIVVGRVDMSKSIGLTCKSSDSETLFKIVNELSIKAKILNKIFTVGGGVSDNSIEFFKRIQGNLERFETRKIIFDAKSIFNNSAKESIFKAINFEINWIKLRQELGILQIKDTKRLKILEERCENFSNTTKIG